MDGHLRRALDKHGLPDMCKKEEPEVSGEEEDDDEALWYFLQQNLQEDANTSPVSTDVQKKNLQEDNTPPWRKKCKVAASSTEPSPAQSIPAVESSSNEKWEQEAAVAAAAIHEAIDEWATDAAKGFHPNAPGTGTVKTRERRERRIRGQVPAMGNPNTVARRERYEKAAARKLWLLQHGPAVPFPAEIAAQKPQCAPPVPRPPGPCVVIRPKPGWLLRPPQMRSVPFQPQPPPIPNKVMPKRPKR